MCFCKINHLSMKLVVKTKPTSNVEEDRIISFFFEKGRKHILFSKLALLPFLYEFLNTILSKLSYQYIIAESYYRNLVKAGIKVFSFPRLCNKNEFVFSLCYGEKIIQKQIFLHINNTDKK